MNKKSLIGVSILAIIIICLGSQSSVVGYRVAKDSQQNLIKKTLLQDESSVKALQDVVNKLKTTSYYPYLQIFLYVIGFAYGLVTLIPWTIISFIISILLLPEIYKVASEVTWYYSYSRIGVFLVSIILCLSMWMAGILVYPFACGAVCLEIVFAILDELFQDSQKTGSNPARQRFHE